MNCDLDSSIPDWIIEYPGTTTVFNEFGLDISCAGKSLAYVCHHQGLSLPDVLRRLQSVVENTTANDLRDFAE